MKFLFGDWITVGQQDLVFYDFQLGQKFFGIVVSKINNRSKPHPVETCGCKRRS